MHEQKLVLRRFDSYVALIYGSVNSKLFKNRFADVGGEKKDILQDGNLSCAFFVASILMVSYLIRDMHVTVSGTVRDMEQFGWSALYKPALGAVLVWEKMVQETGVYPHIGFYIGENRAVSNHPERKVPYPHHFTFGITEDGKPVRKIEAIYWHPKLGEPIFDPVC